jgi:hypothetical protein
MEKKACKYELWEVKFLSFILIHDVFVPSKGGKDEARDANAFAELVQFLDDWSLNISNNKRGKRKWKESFGDIKRTYCKGTDLTSTTATLRDH